MAAARCASERTRLRKDPPRLERRRAGVDSVHAPCGGRPLHACPDASNSAGTQKPQVARVPITVELKHT
eukprot:CAMPEP_0206841374 /NCGR_PEP_ID=MMETSP0975-20121206/22419_1 /ASSEMBLY_ACC=CAM_ASM_000399 /TAXON_ID=483370 /ORGANISM="non described non described, Strain CCMP2097" /LENGTH=68 /DNA_ID=CAMNT_0054383883 /DNA_START=22 /DNA_END=228 /DNA_ORIENTATION=-